MVDVNAIDRRYQWEIERARERERIAAGPTALIDARGMPLPQGEIDRLNRSYAAIQAAGGAPTSEQQAIGPFVELVFQLACDLYDNGRVPLIRDTLVSIFNSIPAGVEALQIYMTFQPVDRRELRRSIAKDHAAEYLSYFGRMDFYAIFLARAVKVLRANRAAFNFFRDDWPTSLKRDFEALDAVQRYFDIMEEKRHNAESQDYIRTLVIKITQLVAQNPRLFAAYPDLFENLLIYQNAMFKADYTVNGDQ